MSLLSRSLIAFGLLLASFASPLGTAVAANTADESSLKEATTKCMQQDRDACASVGMAYYLGQNVAQNYSLATEYLTLACDLQDSCAAKQLRLQKFWNNVPQRVRCFSKSRSCR